jgi:hypothetical protein
MLLFYCNYCHEMLTGTDYENPAQIVDRLEKHLIKCSAATFSYEGTSGILPGENLAVYELSLRVSVL